MHLYGTHPYYTPSYLYTLKSKCSQSSNNIILKFSCVIFAGTESLDPLTPSSNNTTSGSTIDITIIIAVTSVTTTVTALFVIVCGLILIKLLKSAKYSAPSETLPAEPHLQVIPVYESVFPMEFEENVELNYNIAYGTICQLPATRAL